MQNPHRKGALGGALAALAIALIATSFALTQRPAHAADASVSIVGFAFVQPTVNIDVGDTVTWTNNDATAHTASSTSGPVSFDSGTLNPTNSFAFTFTQAGTYAYRCNIHPTILGTVVVGQQATVTTTATTTTTTATATATTATATSTATPTQTATSTPTATSTTAAPTATATGTTAPATAAPAPPSTGSGTVGGTSSALLLILAGLGSIALTGGALIAIRKRA